MKKRTKALVRHIRLIPRTRIPDDLAGKLGDVAVRAATLRKNTPLDPESDAATFLHAGAALIVDKAINHFLSQKAHGLPSAVLRKETGRSSALVVAIKTLLKQLSAGDVPPFEQMRALYCYGDPDSDGLNADERKNETVWDRQLSPSALVASLGQWLELLGKLHKLAGKGRQPITAQRDFVRELADWWRREVLTDMTASIGSSRGVPEQLRETARGERGFFATFVKTASEGIPGRSLSWDQAIREISEENR
jgi:hypothetical protein